MTAIEKAVAEHRLDDLGKYLPDRWLADITLFGPAAKIREGVEAWRAAGLPPRCWCRFPPTAIRGLQYGSCSTPLPIEPVSHRCRWHTP
jgi:hypothetical protein